MFRARDKRQLVLEDEKEKIFGSRAMSSLSEKRVSHKARFLMIPRSSHAGNSRETRL